MAMNPEEFLKEFLRINADFNEASSELRRLYWFQFIRSKNCFRRMKKANLEMEMLRKRSIVNVRTK